MIVICSYSRHYYCKTILGHPVPVFQVYGLAHEDALTLIKKEGNFHIISHRENPRKRATGRINLVYFSNKSKI